MHADDGSGRYVAFGVALIVFGVISLFSIGYPLISLGIAHLLLYRVRHRRSVRLPVMVGLIGFWIAFVLVVPMSCTSTEDDAGTIAGSCRSLTGIRYPVEDPTFVPGLVAGIVVGVLVAAVVRVRVRAEDAAQP